MTKIIIAQRVSSVMDADQIVILEDGNIHAVGSTRELLVDRSNLSGTLLFAAEGRRGRWRDSLMETSKEFKDARY